MGDDGVVTALPYLQPPVLTDSVRHAFRRHRGALAELRATAAATTGTTPPPLVQLERVQPRSLALALATFVGVYALFGQLGSVSQLRDELSGAVWGWIVVAALLSAATNVAYAIAYVGATTARLPFGRTGRAAGCWLVHQPHRTERARHCRDQRAVPAGRACPCLGKRSGRCS